jgi:O-antigen ligase
MLYERRMIQALVVLAALCALGLTLRFPRATCVLWILLLESSPDAWAAPLIGDRETIIGLLKTSGLVLVVALGLRHGWRRDSYNPALAFAFMFMTGLAHGLYPGLTLASSLRSLTGSAAPFLFSFVRLPQNFTATVQRAIIWAPLATVGFGVLLSLLGLGHFYTVEQGAIRLGGPGEPAFLAGFALTGFYAGLMAFLHTPTRAATFGILVNFTLILLTGARTPLALAVLFSLGLLIAQRRLLLLAAAAALFSLGLIFLNTISFLRVVNLTQLGEASNLSNRNLVWPYFQQAFLASPWVGWGTGAGKVVIPLTASLATLIGTNAAHNEYLRMATEGGIIGLTLLVTLLTLWSIRGSAPLPTAQRWLVRLTFLGFALHSATDNTLIATTASIFFLWASTVFATPPERSSLPA